MSPPRRVRRRGRAAADPTGADWPVERPARQGAGSRSEKPMTPALATS